MAKVKKVQFGSEVIVMKENRQSKPRYNYYLRKEISIIKTLKHPNIVQYITSFDYKDALRRRHLGYFMESCDGDLDPNNPSVVDVPNVLYIIKSISLGVKYIHDKNIVHLDIKPKNILKCGAVYKISDFGFGTRILPDKMYRFDIGTELFAAREAKENRFEFPKRMDIFSLGMTFAVLLNRFPAREQSKYHTQTFTEYFSFFASNSGSHLDVTEDDLAQSELKLLEDSDPVQRTWLLIEHLLLTMLVNESDKRATIESVIDQIDKIMSYLLSLQDNSSVSTMVL